MPHASQHSPPPPTAEHTCGEGRGSMNCRACNAGVPYDWSRDPGRLLADAVFGKRRAREALAEPQLVHPFASRLGKPLTPRPEASPTRAQLRKGFTSALCESVRRLRAHGLSNDEIERALGATTGWAAEALRDPS